MARIYANNVTSNSMRINVTELTYPAKDYGGFEIVLVKSSTQEYVYWNNWTSTNSTYNTWHDIYNSMPSPPLYQKLTPNTEYKVSVSGKWDGTWYLIDTIYVTTAAKARPPYFSWDTPKNSGQQFNVTASEWNRLIQNIKDVHIYKLGGYNSSSYPMSNVSSGQQFYAQRFNEVRFAIGSLNSTGINNKYKGDTIYASELNILKDKLNAIT